ncbi:MAG TPA: M42 family metallopeptidase [Candidatus Ozemobacteraceae bacterium]|nr:M42 family metallopeptidase [Candidatus Ozemobacteraceae bacterium]
MARIMKRKPGRTVTNDRSPGIVELLRDLEAIPSPSGFTEEIAQHLIRTAEKAGITGRLTNKGGVLIGNHPAPTLLVSGHVDTLGAMVSHINGDGTLAITKIGGPLLPSFEGNYLTVCTDAGMRYRGTLLLNNPAAHVNRAAESTERKPESMHVRLDAEVRRAADVEKLGIGVGDFVCFDARFEHTDTGFVKAHFLDDKAGSAVMLATLLELGAARLKKLPVCFFFTTYEEVGHGACAGIPESVREMLVVDMGVVGDRVAGDEYSVSICAKDSSGPYDLGMRRKLVGLARNNGIPHKVDVFPFYGSDGSAALRAGHDLRVGLIGPGVSASHGCERTHETGLRATRDLLVAYLKQ